MKIADEWWTGGRNEGWGIEDSLRGPRGPGNILQVLLWQSLVLTSAQYSNMSSQCAHASNSAFHKT